MKFSCEMIQDLLPLYLDGVCSEKSKEAVEEHLKECSDCKAMYTVMRETENMNVCADDAEWEHQKAASFRAVKKKIFRKQLLVAAISVVVLGLIALGTIGILKNMVEVVEYEDNVSVAMVDGNLVGRLQGSQETHVKIKRVTNTVNGQEENYLFFYVSDTKWDALITSSKMFSEYTLCYADKGANQIDAVYYYTGDYTGIESMSTEELQTIIDTSTILWQK